jgi:ABC-type transport system involved in multi-copper enzyme maturation permease subunit
MDSPQAIYVFRWLIRDTFCQALTSRAFWVMLGVTVICTVFCLGVRVHGGEGLTTPDDPFLFDPKTNQPLTRGGIELGSIDLLFGLVHVGLPRDRAAGVLLLHVAFGSWVAGTGGVLLLLLWASSLVPEFLQPANAAVLLTKPPPYWLVLAGKYLGVMLFVAVQAGLFFGCTFVALGVSTGVWPAGYLAGAPLMVLHFAALYSFAVLLGVSTRSTMAAALGTLLFWVACVSVNSARVAAVGMPEVAPEARYLTPASRMLAEASYWALPKPLDYLVLLEQALGASKVQMTLSDLADWQRVLMANRFDPPLIIFSSLLNSLFLLVLAGAQLARIEY